MRYICGGMPLKEYCSKHSLDYNQILNRIKKITEHGIKLSGKEMLDVVLNDDNYHSFIEPSKKYYYNGMLLSDYCLKNEINYKLIIGRIFSLRREGIKEEELVNIALNNDLYYTQSKKYKYLYGNTTLMNYCKEKGYDYQLILRRYRRLKEKYSDKTDEEIYMIVFDEKLYFETIDQYKYRGMTLFKYCNENDLDYSNVIRRMKKTREKNPKMKIDEAIDESVKHYLYLANKNRHTNRYYYEGYILKEYCEINDINYNSVRHRIKKIRLIDQELSNTELVRIALNEDLYNDYVIDEYRKSKYYYQGVPLKVYCKNANIDYCRIITRIRLLRGKVDESKIIEIALNDNEYHSFVNERKISKYYLYEGYTLKKYCKLNGLDYIKVLEEVCKIAEKNPEMSSNEVIELAIKRQDEVFVLNERILKIKEQKQQLIDMKENLLNNTQEKQLIKK